MAIQNPTTTSNDEFPKHLPKIHFTSVITCFAPFAWLMASLSGVTRAWRSSPQRATREGPMFRFKVNDAALSKFNLFASAKWMSDDIVSTADDVIFKFAAGN